MAKADVFDRLEKAIGEFPLDWQENQHHWGEEAAAAQDELEAAWEDFLNAYRGLAAALDRVPEW